MYNIEVETILSSKQTAAFINLLLNRKRLFSIIAAILLIPSSLVLILLFEMQTLGAIVLFVAVFCLVFILLIPKLIQKQTDKNLNLISNSIKTVFKFGEEELIIEETIGDKGASESKLKYSILFKAYETKSHFFLMISNVQGHVIPKEDITKGSASELSALLSDKLNKGFRYLNLK